MPHQLPSVIYLKLCMQDEIDGRDPSGYVGLHVVNMRHS